jgi:4-hydroxybenzoate polyprenyltransferase
MKKLNQYLSLIRLKSQTGTVLLFYPCLSGLIIGNHFLIDLFLAKYAFLLIFGAFCMRSAGCIINDLWDVKIDRGVERTKNRPLASGKITRIEAFLLLFLMCLGGVFVLVSLPFKAVISGLIGGVFMVIYPLFKRFFVLPQIFLGITFNIGIFVGFLCFQNKLNATVWLIYFMLIIWTFIYDTLYAMQDYEDDIKMSVKSSAVFLGGKTQFILQILCVALGCFLCFFGLLNAKIVKFFLECLLFVLINWVLVDFAFRTKNFKKSFDFHIIIGLLINLLLIN